MDDGRVKAISISEERGCLKREIDEADFVRDHGILGDGHAGDWGRQVTCLDWAAVREANAENGLDAGPGDFAENVLIEGLDLSGLRVGSRLRLGRSVVLEVTQIGKEDGPSIVSRTFGISLLPYIGLFCRVLEGGRVRRGDPVRIL